MAVELVLLDIAARALNALSGLLPEGHPTYYATNRALHELWSLREAIEAMRP